MKLRPIKREGTGCNVCSRWTPLLGCAHRHPANHELINAIIAAAHGGNIEIIETTDFRQGVALALIALKQNDLLKAVSCPPGTA